MGYIEQPIVDWKFMSDNLALEGKLMYERDDMVLFAEMLERGLSLKGKDPVKTKSYGMENWEHAFDMATEYTGVGRSVGISP